MANTTKSTTGTTSATSATGTNEGTNEGTTAPSSSAKNGKTKERRKKCAKCGKIKSVEEFNISTTSHDGKQSYCKACKNDMHKQRHKQNARARLRHHMATRIASQLGELAPKGLTKDLDEYLGYGIGALVRSLRADLQQREGIRLVDALEEGWHVDHIKPLSSFKVIKDGKVDWDEFRKCWAIDNLRAISASENLAKGAKYNESATSK